MRTPFAASCLFVGALFLPFASYAADAAMDGSSVKTAAKDSTKHDRAEDRVEERIKRMHSKLEITPAQEGQWAKVTELMLSSAKQLDALTKTRAEKADMNAMEDLRSYSAIADAHADGIKRFTPVFETLYISMSDAQKKAADALFRHGDKMSKMPKHHH